MYQQVFNVTNIGNITVRQSEITATIQQQLNVIAHLHIDNELDV